MLHRVVCVQLSPDQGMVPADHPTDLRRRCEEEAQQMVHLSNTQRDGQPSVTNPSLTHLISRLAALLLQIKVEDRETFNKAGYTAVHQILTSSLCLFQCLADGGDLNSFEFKSLTDSLNDIKASIDPSNLR